MSGCLVQVYCEDGEEFGLYRYDSDKIKPSYVDNLIPLLFSLYGEDERFYTALEERGIERVFAEQEINLPGGDVDGDEPVKVVCRVRFKDEKETVLRTFAIGIFDDKHDDDVFFWVDSFDGLEALMSESNDADFVVCDLVELAG